MNEVRNNVSFSGVVSKVQSIPVSSPAPVKSIVQNTTFAISDEQKKRWKDSSVLLPVALKTAEKIREIGRELKGVLVERDDLIDDMMVAIATGNHAVLLGAPGIAKSLLTREICKRIIGGNYFEWLLSKTSDPSEILGPFSIKALEQDKFMRKTDGKLPWAHVAFLDELFKSNEPTLNVLLAILNERVFHNDGVAIPVPLISMVGASNEEPEDEDNLKALYDRILFRFVVDGIENPINRLNMYKGFLDRRNPGTTNDPEHTVTVEELNDIRMASRYVTIPRDIMNQYDSILQDLRTKHQITVSDRRKNEGLGVLQGSAILKGRDVVTVDDFRHLIPVWWQRREDIKVVHEMIIKIINPFESKLIDHKASIDGVMKRIQDASGTGKTEDVLLEARQLLNNVGRDLEVMIKQAKERGKDTSKIEDMRKLVYTKQKDLLKNNFGVDESILESIGMSIDGDDISF